MIEIPTTAWVQNMWGEWCFCTPHHIVAKIVWVDDDPEGRHFHTRITFDYPALGHHCKAFSSLFVAQCEIDNRWWNAFVGELDRGHYEYNEDGSVRRTALGKVYEETERKAHMDRLYRIVASRSRAA